MKRGKLKKRTLPIKSLGPMVFHFGSRTFYAIWMKTLNRKRQLCTFLRLKRAVFIFNANSVFNAAFALVQRLLKSL